MSKQPSEPRVVILAGAGDSTSIVYNGLRREIPIARVIIEEPVPRTTFIKRRLKKLGARKVSGQILFQLGVVPLLQKSARSRIESIVREHGIDLTPPDESVVERVPSANDHACIEALRRLAPDVVVVNGTRILSKQILECVPATFLNTHAGITPIYRGVHGGYWALAQNRRDLCGVTVHVVDTGIDTGKIVAQALIEPRPDDSFVTYPYLQTAIALPILVRAVRDAAAGTLTFQRPPAGDSKLWSHPTLGQYLWHRVVDGVR